MGDNPYSSPVPTAKVPSPSIEGALPPAEARQIVRVPAIVLIVLSAVWIAMILMGLGALVFVYTQDIEPVGSPRFDNLPQAYGTLVPMLWYVVMLGTNLVILIAGIRMYSLRNYNLCLTGVVLAAIPCFGPCYLLAIPFAIWALFALAKPGVRDAFT